MFATVLTAAQTAVVKSLSFVGTRAAVEFEFEFGGRFWERGTDCASIIKDYACALDTEQMFVSDVDCYCYACVCERLTYDRHDREDMRAFSETVRVIDQAHRWFDEAAAARR